MAKQALAGSRLNAFSMDPNKLIIVGLDTDDGPEHPLYDVRIKLPLDEALVKNIMANGVLETVNVRKDGERVEVVFGRQRVRAAREANRRLESEGKLAVKVPVLVRRGKERDLFGVMISENEVRQDNGPLAKADLLQRYLEMGSSEDEAAIQFGVSKQTIKNWLVLLDLDSSVRKAVENNQISAHAASSLGKLDREAQKAALADMLADGAGKPTAKKARERATGESSAPGKRVIKKVIEIHDELVAEEYEGLPEDFIRALRWVLGELGDTNIKGLKAIRAEAEGGPKVGG